MSKGSKLKKKKLAVDTETTGLNRWRGHRAFAVSMMDEDGNGMYWEWDVDPFTREVKVPKADRLELIDILVKDPRYIKYMFNTKFDLFMFEAMGIDIPIHNLDGSINCHEVSWMARACNNLELVYKLKVLAKKYVDIDDADEKQLADVVKHCRTLAKSMGWNIATEENGFGKEPFKADYWLPHMMGKLHPKLVKGLNLSVNEDYAMIDAERTLDLAGYYEEGMDRFNIWESYEREMRILPITMSMEREGVQIDVPRMRKVQRATLRKANRAKSILKKAYGGEINPNSPKQLQELLFEGKPLNLPVTDRTKTGNAKTGAEFLKPHFGNPIVDALMTYKSNTKANNTFFKKYDELMTEGSILHPGYNQLGTLTWRYSCSEPNLQQVSSPESSNSLARDYLVDIRQIFKPRDGYVMFAPDYAQVEVIIFAAVYKIESLLTKIREGMHVHKAIADQLYGGKDNHHYNTVIEEVSLITDTPETKVKKLYSKLNYSVADLEASLGSSVFKKRSKSATFTKIFGGGPTAMMGWMPGITFKEAASVLDHFDSSFPDMVDAMEDIIYTGKKEGYIITPYGVKLSVDPWFAYRIVNHVVQSSAASQMKIGMLKCWEWIQKSGLDIKILMTIHDELIFEVHKSVYKKRNLRKLCSLMVDHEGRLPIDLSVDAEYMPERWSMKEKVTL